MGASVVLLVIISSQEQFQDLRLTSVKDVTRTYLFLNGFQNGDSREEDSSTGCITWYKISKNLEDFYHVTRIELL